MGGGSVNDPGPGRFTHAVGTPALVVIPNAPPQTLLTGRSSAEREELSFDEWWRVEFAVIGFFGCAVPPAL